MINQAIQDCRQQASVYGQSSGMPRARAAVAPANLIGSSDATRSLRASVARAAARKPLRAIVLGEYGTGKKNIAAAIHCEGADDHGLQVVDCSEASAQQFVSQYVADVLAGVEDSSVLLLDSLERLPSAAQRELAECLARAHTDQGQQGPHILATVRDSIGQLVDRGALCAVLVEALGSLVFVPPLRRRANDIEELTTRFVTAMNGEFGKACTPSSRLLASYGEYHWPGNVRELKSVTATLYHAAEPGGDLAQRLDLVPELLNHTQSNVRPLVGSTLSDVKRELFVETLAHHGGDKRLTARTLGISMKTLYNRMREYRPVA